jgi:hypothetical protein
MAGLRWAIHPPPPRRRELHLQTTQQGILLQATRKHKRVSTLHSPETRPPHLYPAGSILSPEAYRKRVTDMATEIEEDAAAARRRTGVEPLGVAAILGQDPVRAFNPHGRRRVYPGTIQGHPAPSSARFADSQFGAIRWVDDQ